VRSSLVLAVALTFPAFPVIPLWEPAKYGPARHAVVTGDAASAEERALIEAAQQGDHDALRSLLERLSRPLYAAVILPRIGNRVDAEDVLRDTLSRAVEKLNTFRWTGVGFYPWLRQIAMRLIIDRARSKARRTRAEDEMERQAGVLQPLHHAGALEMLIEQQERSVALRMLEEAMDTLSDRYRQAVELRLLQERPREECATEMGVTVNNFDVILHRALAALRKAYGVR